jgi:hypothetical protein
MKPFIISALSFTFALTQVGTADDIARSKPAAERSARPPVSARTSAVDTDAGRNRPALHPNPNIRRSPPTFAQPVQGAPLVAMNTQVPLRNLPPKQNPADQRQQKVSVTAENLQRPNNNRQSYFDALRRCRHERHDCNWWKQHCTTIVFVRTGYYYLDAGYWYPAWGYDPAYNYYDYDGPIYTYGNLLPDQVIANVQRALQQAGYYLGPVTGSLGSATRAALTNYQRDYGLIITGAIDEPTVESLGLN